MYSKSLLSRDLYANRLSGRRSLVCKAHSSNDLPNSRVRQSYRLLTEQARIGAEHGEGFDNFRSASPFVRVDVDNLNEQLKATGLSRHRHRLKPDEAFGMVFSFEGVIADTNALQANAWQLLAEQEQRALPRSTTSHICQQAPERAIMETLKWTDDLSTAQKLAWRFASIYTELLTTAVKPKPGVTEWLQLLAKYNIPCALITRMDRQTVRSALERMVLHDYLPVCVAAEDEMETEAQQLLAAAMRLRRPPNLCVAFASSPAAITAAHNCTMKSVAVHGGSYKAWELKSADLTVSRLDDLTVYNLRRLFANVGDEFMDTKQQLSNPEDSTNNKHRHRRRIANAMMDD